MARPYTPPHTVAEANRVPDREAVLPRLQVRLGQGDFLLHMGFPLSASNNHLSHVELDWNRPSQSLQYFFPEGGHRS